MVSIRTNTMQDHSLYQLKLKNEKISNLSEKLATGKRINHASDDAAGLSIATRLISQISSNTISGRNLSDGISLSQTADGALSSIESVLQRLRELAIRSKNETLNTNDKNDIQKEMNQLLNEINYVSKSSRYNGVYIFDPLANVQQQNLYISSNNSFVQPKTLFSNTDWSKSIQVSKIAKGLQVSSNSFSPIIPLGLNGTFALAGKLFSVQISDSLDDIKNMINNGNIPVIASIDTNNQLIFTSTQVGSSAVFSANDLTTNGINLNVSNSSVADILSNNSSNSWSHTIEVTQMGTPEILVKNYINDFATNDLSTKWTSLGGSWSNSGGKLNQNSSGGLSQVFGLLANDTISYDKNRKVSVTTVGMNAQFDAGAYINYVDANNFTRSWFDRGGGNKLYLEKMVNGVSTVISSANTTFQANKQYTFEAETDGLGNYTARVIDKSNGSLVRQISASGWTDAATTGGKSGLIGIQNPTNYDDFSVTAGYYAAATPTNYKVDGTTYSSYSNTISLPEADISLKNVGTSVITSEKTDAVLNDIGILSGNNYQNILQNAQDTTYTIDGTTYTQPTNQVLLKNTNGSLLGTVDIKDVGSAIISNTNPNTPKTIQIHSGYDSENIYKMKLSDVSTTSLGIDALQYDDPYLIDRIDFALSTISDERTKFGVYQNAIAGREDSLSSQTIEIEKTKSKIQDVDMAELTSEKIKNSILGKSALATYNESINQMRTYLNLLS